MKQFTCDIDLRFGKTGRTWHSTDGTTIVYQDGLGRWHREDDREDTFDTAREAFEAVVRIPA